MIYTRLDLVNEVLSVVGFLRLSAQDELHPDYVTANDMLERTNKRIQAHGYWFNTSYPELLPSPEGEIVIPGNALSVDPDNRGQNDLVVREGKLFNKTTRSFNIGGPIKVKLVELIDLDDIPATAQMFVLAAARLRYFFDNDGENNKKADLEKEYGAALGAFHSDQLAHEDLNVLNGTSMIYHRYGRSGGRFNLRHGSS